jgi:hypothetical protein
LVAHENLEIYSTLQRITNYF